MAGQNPRWSKPAACDGCALQHKGFGFAPPSGPLGARLTFVGEALGYEEAIAGEPFYGSAGGVLSRICIRAGIERSHCRIANVVSCRPPGDYLVGAPWEAHAIQQCRTYLLPVLDSVPNGGCVVTLGATALQAVLQLTGQKGVTVKDFHGTVHKVTRADGTYYWVVPTFHPSHLQRGAMNLLEVVTQDLKLAWKIAHSGFQRSHVELIVDPPVEWFRRWIDEYAGKLDRDNDGTHLAIDSEFPEKAPGADEGELLDWNAQSPMTRVNGASDGVIGWSVPYAGDYIREFDRLLTIARTSRAYMWLWNKYADIDHFTAAGHIVDGIEAIDGMWAWHHIQSDVPRGLGFVAPMASDFGAWKHWAHIEAKFGEYAAADGVQTWRTCMWILRAMHQLGMWDMFMRDWHERDTYVLRPAYHMGVPINVQELDAFHESNQRKLGSVLERIKQTAAQGVLKPKLGYATAPSIKCGECDGAGKIEIEVQDRPIEDGGALYQEMTCPVCEGRKRVPQTQPPASILGKPKKGGGEAKTQYMNEGVRLVEKEVDVEVRVCLTCSPDRAVGPKHKCPLPKAVKTGKRRRRSDNVEGGVEPVLRPAEGSGEAQVTRPTSQVVTATRRVLRYFWQLPFNPDAPQQVLAYLAQQGIAAPIDKKKQKATTNKKALQDLAKQYRDNPFFQLQLDWKAVQKVDAVYAVGTKALLDKDNRVHPEYLPIPSTLRDSARHPNLTNVVADKAGVQGLASGFRRVIEARDGVPAVITPEEYAAWEARWR